MLAIFVCIALLRILAPRQYEAFTDLLHRIGQRAGDAVSWLLLGLVYLFVFVPISAVNRLSAADRLQIRGRRSSYWVDRGAEDDTSIIRSYGREPSQGGRAGGHNLLKAARFAIVLGLIALLLDVGLGLGGRAVLRYVRPEHSHFWRIAPSGLNGQDRLQFARELESILELARFKPFVQYRRADYSGRFFNVRDGIRQTYDPQGNGASKVQIFVFGGSAAWGFAARDARTIPSEIARLAAEKGHSWSVVNYAEPGYVSWQEVILLAELCAAGKVPSAVVFYDGYNDVIARYQEPLEPRPILDQDWWRRGIDQMFKGELRLPTLASLLFRYRTISITATVLRRVGLIREHRGNLTAPESPSLDPRILGRDLADAYQQNAEIVRALADHYGFEAVFVWQPALYSKDSLDPRERNLVDLEDTDERFAATMYLVASARIAEYPDILDLSDLFDGDDGRVFLDRVHVAEEQNRRIAAAIYRDLPLSLTAGER